MHPALGKIVIVKGLDVDGQDEHPGIITRVTGKADPGPGSWSDVSNVNVTMFPDGGATTALASVFLFENRTTAIAWKEAQKDAPPPVPAPAPAAPPAPSGQAPAPVEKAVTPNAYVAYWAS